MKLSNALHGRSLLLRLYLFEAILFTALLATFGAVGRYILEPGMTTELRRNLVWTGSEILDSTNEPARLERQLSRLHNGTDVTATLFAPEGRIIAGRAQDTSTPLDAALLARLSHQGSITLSPHSVAVGSVKDGQLSAFVIVSLRPHFPPLWNAALVYGIVLVLLGMGSIPLARWITRPLERLTTVTQAFGLGDLRARADTSRRDEVGDLARAFNTMADRVESLRRTEKELLANVSHELRTPLARIRVLLELAEDDVPNDAKRYLGDISDDLTELEQLLADVIATAKLDIAHASQQDPYPPLRLLPVSTSELLESIVGKFRRHNSGRIVTAQFASESTLLADRVMLTHAISNILDNAEKYSPPSQPIEIFIKVQDSSIAIIVRDCGVGIASDDLPNVFTPFFRADPSRTRRTGGVGLGLTLAKRLIEAHGGTIAIESHLGQGTEVTVRLPSNSNITT